MTAPAFATAEPPEPIEPIEPPEPPEPIEPAIEAPPGGRDPIERELALIVARVRLALQKLAAWSGNRAQRIRDGAPLEAAAAQRPGWLDAWTDGDLRRGWAERDDRGQVLARSQALVERDLRDHGVRSRRLAETLGLDDRELDLLHVLLATAVTPDLGGLIAAVTGRAIPTEALIAALFDHGPQRVLTPASALVRWSVCRKVELAPGDGDGLAIDPAILDWFTGAYAVEAALAGAVRPVTPRAPLAGWPIAETCAQIAPCWNREGGLRAVRVIVSAPPGTGRTTFAVAIAAEVGLGFVALDGDAIADDGWREFLIRAHRQAFLGRAAIGFVGEQVARRDWNAMPVPFPLTFVCVEPGAVLRPQPETVDIHVELPAATVADRTHLWRALVPAAATWSDDAVDALATSYRANPGDIADAAHRNLTAPDQVRALMRDRDRHRLGELAQPLACPFTWDDLILPAQVVEVLRDFEHEGRTRAELWEDPSLRRMFPQGRGLFAFLTGSPGTGKTMTAQVIARALGLNLYRISLSGVISKYIGETAKNLTRILARAEHMDAVLLFDEADALFGKRTEIKDAHDRHANTDTNHLLQAIESYAGVAILASNKRANVDPAFIRRLRYVVELPRPDPAQRRALWTSIVGGIAPAGTTTRLAAPLELLAATVDLTGAQIKYAALAALLAARRAGGDITAGHLARGVERELQKDGRALGEREREQVLRAG